MSAVTRPPSVIHTVWAGDHRFDSSRGEGPTLHLDGSGQAGLTPPEALVGALAACSGIDVVAILAKRRTPVERLAIETVAERREEAPRRFTRLRLIYRLHGVGIERVHAERAVALAFEKYCSVAASLAPDTVVTTDVELNGTAGDAVEQPMGR